MNEEVRRLEEELGAEINDGTQQTRGETFKRGLGSALNVEPEIHAHSNDANLEQGVNLVSGFFKAYGKRWGENNVGIVVGTGGLLSICTEVPVNVWLVIDCNQTTLNAFAKILGNARTAKTLEEYIDANYENPNAELSRVQWMAERQNLGRFHLTANEHRFQQAKQALEGKAVVLCCGDLCDKQFMERIRDALLKRSLRIAFANCTNVFEHAPGVEKFFPILPFEKGAVVMWSECDISSIQSRVSVGLKRYLDCAKKTYHGACGAIDEHEARSKLVHATRMLEAKIARVNARTAGLQSRATLLK